MNPARIRRAVLCLLAVVTSAVSACGTREATPTTPPTGAPSPSPTATATLAPTPTASPTITPWPTRTPEPTWTPTPHPLAGESERILFVCDRGGYQNLYSMDPTGRQRAQITGEGVNDSVPDWSSAADQLVFISDRDGDVEIYALKPGDYFPRNLTNDPAGDWNPDWSPDGARIAFESDRDDDNDEIYVMNADGSNVVRLTEDPAADWMPDWSPDGARIAFVSDRDGDEDIWVMGADGADPVNLTRTENNCEDPAWSPDGERIAFSQYVDGNWDLYLVDVAAAIAGTEPPDLTRLTDDPDTDAWPTWSPDGQRIAFASFRTGNGEIYVLDPASPADSQVNLSRHSAEDSRPNWVQTPSLAAMLVEETSVFRLLGADPPHLDPALCEDAASHEYINEIFSGLVRLDEDLNVAPDIAAHWGISDDGTVYTFRLREDVKFHDGRPMTAYDIEYSIDRACDPELGSNTASSYLGDIVGVAEVVAGAADHVSGVRVVDDYTLEITIDAPKAYFLAKLTYPSSYVVDRETIEEWGDEWEQHPVGTGPFRLVMWVEDERIILVRNDYYYAGVPTLKRVTYEMSGIPMLMYEEGDLETVPIGIDDVQRVKDPESPLHQELVEVPILSTSYVAFNCAVPPFDDPLVRRAFAHAFDKEKLVEVTFEGTVIEAHGVLPPGMPAYDPDLEGIAYDADRALELLAESSYGGAEGLPEITMVSSGLGGYVDPVDEAFISQIRENLDVEMAIEILEPEDFYEAIQGEHTYQVFTSAWGADYVDPENFLDLLFHSESEANDYRYANAELDALLEQARTETDTDRCWALYREAERMIVDDAVWIPLFHGMAHYLVKPYVEGLVYTSQGIAELGGVSLEDR